MSAQRFDKQPFPAVSPFKLNRFILSLQGLDSSLLANVFCMTLPEQCAVLLETIEYGLLKPEDVVRWVDKVVAETDKPPAWLIEFYTVEASCVRSYELMLREHSSGMLSVRTRVQIILLAYPARLPLSIEMLSKIFEVAIFNEASNQSDALEERLSEALVYWDCQDHIEVGRPLEDKFSEIFQEYLSDANEVAAVLPWKFVKGAYRS
jgi:hypothetical protein